MNHVWRQGIQAFSRRNIVNLQSSSFRLYCPSVYFFTPEMAAMIQCVSETSKCVIMRDHLLTLQCPAGSVIVAKQRRKVFHFPLHGRYEVRFLNLVFSFTTIYPHYAGAFHPCKVCILISGWTWNHQYPVAAWIGNCLFLKTSLAVRMSAGGKCMRESMRRNHLVVVPVFITRQKTLDIYTIYIYICQVFFGAWRMTVGQYRKTDVLWVCFWQW
jgi:hypothetical protein